MEIADDILGHGPLERLLADDTVSEIMVNGPYDVWVERQGKLMQTSVRFHDDSHLRRILNKIVAQVGRRVDESSAMVDARLPDGSRINAIIPPLSLTGPLVTIRKFSRNRLNFQDLIRLGTATTETIEFLERCIQARLNILISGGTGSGKTTLLNVLSEGIPDTERIVTIEDSAELPLHQRHILRLESRPPNIEGEGEVSIRDLVRNSLRMRPDRIIIGEVRGAEALDMLQAMNTGHDGSLSTVHANSARDALGRLETMVMMAGFEIPLRAVRQQVSSALDLVIQIERLEDGGRRITSISEVQRMESDVITMQELFTWRMEQITGERIFVGNLVVDRPPPDLPEQVREARHPAAVRALPRLSGVRRIGRHGLMKHALRLGLAALAAAVLAGAASSATGAASDRRGRRRDAAGARLHPLASVREVDLAEATSASPRTAGPSAT